MTSPGVDTRDEVHLSKTAKKEIAAAARVSGETVAPAKLQKLIRSCLTPDLLQGKYKKEWNSDKPASWGHCYVASETYYHFMGGKASGLKPYWVKHEGSTHHFLRDTGTGKIIDITGDQFKTTPPYEKGTPFGWLTGETPSKRAQKLMARVKQRISEQSR